MTDFILTHMMFSFRYVLNVFVHLYVFAEVWERLIIKFLTFIVRKLDKLYILYYICIYVITYTEDYIEYYTSVSF